MGFDGGNYFEKKGLPLKVLQVSELGSWREVELCSGLILRCGETGVCRRRALCKMRDVVQTRRVEDENGNSAGFAVIAEKFVHDVRIFVTKKDT